MNKLLILLMVVATSTVLIGNVHAHDIWLETKGDAFNVVYGHPDEMEDYSPSKVKVIRAYGTKGEEIAAKATTDKDQMRVKPAADTSAITVEYDNGYWTKIGPTTWENRSKSEFDQHLESSHSLKYNKNLLGWNKRVAQPMGMKFEIVPLDNPLKKTPDGKINLQVLYKGKPLPNAGLEVHGVDETYKTDANGNIKVALNSKQKFQYIAAYHRLPAPGNLHVDEISLTANLVFNAL